jgi:hypothetical protein
MNVEGAEMRANSSKKDSKEPKRGIPVDRSGNSQSSGRKSIFHTHFSHIHTTTPPERTTTETTTKKPNLSANTEPNPKHNPTEPKQDDTLLRLSEEFDRSRRALFTHFTNTILSTIYPKQCPECGIVLTKTIRTRPSVIRCAKCHYQTSRIKNTPLDNMRIPHWMFGWLLLESSIAYPKVITSKEIQRKLGVAYNTALLLKRRLQLFSTDLTPQMKKLFNEILMKEGSDLPHKNDREFTLGCIQEGSIPVVNADTLVLFSASQRANKGRKRHRHGGQTASIYLSDSLGGKQIGSLVHTIALKGGGVIYQYITDQTTQSLGSQIAEFIPKHSRIFTDEGYPFLQGIYKNHRMVNHSLKSRDNRYRFSGNRWCQNGIHNQVAEGFNNTLKTAFRSYGYFRPENAGLYLAEFSLMANIRHYGLDAILKAGVGNGNTVGGIVGLVSKESLPSHLIYQPTQ